MSRVNHYALEAAIGRSYKTLDLMFPGIRLDIHEDHGRMQHYITVRYNHPKLGLLGWNVCVDAWSLSHHAYVEHLIRDIPQGFTCALVEKAQEFASSNRYSWGN